MPQKLLPRLLLFFLLALLSSSQTFIIKNTGCKTFDQNNVCTLCSLSYYLDSQKICQPVNPNCKTFNPASGACLSCYPGFGLI